MAHSRSFLRITVGAGLLVAGLGSGSAHAATWGSFDATRIAYSTGPLTGDVHMELRAAIEGNGDEVGAPSGELTTEYLQGVDVFYTSMLSDGTGPSAGAPGTLSPDEQSALDDWLVGGGTLIVTVDSNGFMGPFEAVYESWLDAYGVTAFEFVFDFGGGMPNATPHPITDGVGSYAIDNIVTFAYGAEGTLLGTGFQPDQPLLVVFEPETGFSVGGRILVVADHNILTDNFITNEAYDNDILAQNIVEWAASGGGGGVCGDGVMDPGEECDDGNTDDGDGCSATCMVEGGESSSGGGADDTTDDGGPADTTGGAGTTGGGDDDGSTTDAGTGTGTDGGLADGGDESGCGCRGGAPAGTPGWLLLSVLPLAWRRRR